MKGLIWIRYSITAANAAEHWKALKTKRNISVKSVFSPLEKLILHI